jgi:thiol-disulfide isomerase/thioredoxin
LELRFGDGTRKKLGDYLGKVVLLDFWATYCKPCVTKLPLLVALQRELGEQQLAVITITLDPDIATATNWAKANKMTLPIAEFTNNIKEAFFRGQETVAIPQARLLDRDGKLVKSWGPQDSFEKIAATVREMVRHGE